MKQRLYEGTYVCPECDASMNWRTLPPPSFFARTAAPNLDPRTKRTGKIPANNDSVGGKPPVNPKKTRRNSICKSSENRFDAFDEIRSEVLLVALSPVPAGDAPLSMPQRNVLDDGLPAL